MTDRELRELTTFWQMRLGLLDWDIDVRFAKAWEIAEGGVGQCEHHKHTKGARIRLLRPDDLDPSHNPTINNIEHTIVHELLHLHMVYFDQGIERGSAEYDPFELMLNKVASGL